MALSYYSNWGPLHHLNQELTQPELLPPELLNFHDNYLLSDTCIDPLFDQNNFFYSENTFTPLPLPPPPPPPPPQPQIFESYPYPKRVKTQDDFYHSDTINYNYDYDVFVPNPPLPPEFSPELALPLPEFQASSAIRPPVYTCGSSTSNAEQGTSNVKKASGGSLSAQSIAARLRRRKITEKTQELGKLIPGGQKMNTAEMFQAASEYIKFLQAQVGILEPMGSTEDQENEEPLHNPELQALVTSPLVQEKLYSAEKCLVPRKFVETLAEKLEIQSNPQLVKHIIRLL